MVCLLCPGNEEDLIEKVNNSDTSRIRIPKRHSMGPLEYPAEDFIKKGNQDDCAATKVGVSVCMALHIMYGLIWGTDYQL